MGVSVFSYLSDMFSLSDEEAMVRIGRNNDSRAFALLVNRWEGRIEQLCRRFTGDSNAQDLRQEVFMRVYAHRNDYRGEGKFATYLWRIALNVCYDYLRREKRRPGNAISLNSDDEAASEIVLASPEAGPDGVADKNERAELIRRALFSLPEHYQRVVILRHYEGLKFRQIAEVLDIAPGTVKSRMAEGLNRLGRILRPVLSEEAFEQNRKEVL